MEFMMLKLLDQLVCWLGLVPSLALIGSFDYGVIIGAELNTSLSGIQL